ncbi:MAG: hypothetical protein ACKOC5_00640 [Chloroflexota bacterium]
MDMRIDRGPDDFLSELQPGDLREHSPGAYCRVCAEQGACWDWVVGMAPLVGAPAEWLARMVVRGTVTHCDTPAELQQRYAEWLALWQD